MNWILENFARRWMKEQLVNLTAEEIDLFFRMYSPMVMSTGTIVIINELPVCHLDSAMWLFIRMLEKKGAL